MQGWHPFTHRDISRFLAQNAKSKDDYGFLFEALLLPRRNVKGDKIEVFGGGWIIQQGDKYHFTTGFVEDCFRVSVSIPSRKAINQ